MIGSVYINYWVTTVNLGFSYSRFFAGAVGPVFRRFLRQIVRRSSVNFIR